MKRMNKKIVSILLICILAFIGISANIKVEAATTSMSANATTVTVGDSVTVSVSVTAGAWNLAISGGGLTATDGSGLVGQTTTTSNTTTSKNYTFSTSKAGTYAITLTGDITDYDTDETSTVNKSINITVKPKETTPPANTGTTGNGTTGGTSSGGSTTTGNGNGTTTTPSTTAPTEKTPTFTDVNETVYATGSINVRKSYSTSSSIVGTLKKGEAVTRTGKGSNGWSKVTYKGTTAYISSSLLTTTKPAEEIKSSNTALKSLSVDQEGMTPDFSKDIENYILNVDSTIEKLNITAEPEDEKATVKIEGNEALKEGENKVTVVVTAEDGTSKTYMITVTKGVEEEVQGLLLQSLTIKGVDFTDVFKPNVYEYTIDVKKDVSKLDIEAIANQEDATVEITGNEDLQDGENVITIFVKSADGEKVVTYQITVNKAKEIVEEKTNQIDIVLMIVIVAAVLLVIVIIILIIKNHKEKVMDEEDYEQDFMEENEELPQYNPKSTNNYFEDTYVGDEEERPKRGRGKHF